ncbi:MAG: hypothetical protein ACJLUP_16730 [Agrobacterium tumefaciens]
MAVQNFDRAHVQARKALTAFLCEALPHLHWSYNWPMPDALAISGEASPYQQTVLWKIETHRRWMKVSEPERLNIAREVVIEWGGIKRITDSRLLEYVRNCSRRNPSLQLEGVSSYSKLLAVAAPDRYAIYDARVAVALNAIQHIWSKEPGIAFNYLPGRNRITGRSHPSKAGFSFDNRFLIKSLTNNGWQPISQNETYSAYLGLLQSILPEFPDYRLHDLEMALFAEAERLALRAMYGRKDPVGRATSCS